MLSLVFILCVVGLIVSVRINEKHEKLYTWKSAIAGFFVVAIFSSSAFLIFMFSTVRQNDTGYYQQIIDTLTATNKQLEEWSHAVNNKLSDDPQLLNHVEQPLEEEIASNAEEIRVCISTQEKVPLYRWLLYFNLF